MQPVAHRRCKRNMHMLGARIVDARFRSGTKGGSSESSAGRGGGRRSMRSKSLFHGLVHLVPTQSARYHSNAIAEHRISVRLYRVHAHGHPVWRVQAVSKAQWRVSTGRARKGDRVERLERCYRGRAVRARRLKFNERLDRGEFVGRKARVVQAITEEVGKVWSVRMRVTLCRGRGGRRGRGKGGEEKIPQSLTSQRGETVQCKLCCRG